MIEHSDIALKEWAILCQALARGDQTLLLRKGGIHDRRKEFGVDHREFFFFPTYYHAKEEDVVAGAREELRRLQESAPPESEVHVGVFAEVTDAVFVEDRDALGRLEGQHIYSPAAIDYRYHYRRPGLWVLTLRAWRLCQEVVIANTKQYAGCLSWVTLEAPLSTAGARPALSEEAFEKSRKKIFDALG